MLNPAIHCQTLNEQLRDRNKFVMDAFRLYVQMFSLVAGGAAFIAIRPERPPTSFAGLADVLAVLIFIITITLILENSRSWTEYRQRLSELAGKTRGAKLVIPEPKPLHARRADIVMMSAMAISLVLFLLFNPLGSLPKVIASWVC